MGRSTCESDHRQHEASTCKKTQKLQRLRITRQLDLKNCFMATSLLTLAFARHMLLVLAVTGADVNVRSEAAPSSLNMLWRLDAATTALERAQDVTPEARVVPVCAKELAAAVAAVDEAELLLSSDKPVHLARHKVAAARASNNECLKLLSQSHSNLPHTSRMAVFKLVQVADKELEQVEAHLPVPTKKLGSKNRWNEENDFNRDLKDHIKKSPPQYGASGNFEQPAPACSGNAVDGTTCQFQACAKGRGLVSCSIGFTKGIVGGYYGIDYVVTRSDDVADNPPPGTLRYGVNLARENPGGVWITFSRDMIIELKGMIWINSYTTIDGRGYNITLRKQCMVVYNARQVLLENFGINSVKGSDTVHIFGGASKVWVDHVTSFGGDLGLVSVVQGSTDVTISNCKLQNHNFNMLLGASDYDEQDKNLRVTVFRNHFLDSMQRMPHCRWGWCHVANNLYTNWGYYAVGARVKARVRTENNVFVSGRVKEVTPWHPGVSAGGFDMSARIESTGDLLLNGSTYHQFLIATHDVTPPYAPQEYPPIIEADRINRFVEACAGQLTNARTVNACNRSSR
ncbi:hypothetical protein R1flu_018234 [Riccia fluitans]|uniref:Pectate lyase n=1 Tax=Riccia fluitans TaxID=41844 RepID=A0ABD1ZHI5_9MARC